MMSLNMKSKIQVDSLAETVLDICKKEKEWRRLKVPLEDNVLRVAYYTKLPITEIYHFAECSDDCSDTLTNDNSLGSSDHMAIMVCLRDMYKQKALPKMQNLYEVVNARRNQNGGKYTESYDKFCVEVSLLGYSYRRLVNGDCMIMEDPKLTFERYCYLNKLQKICKDYVKIYYLDERTFGEYQMFFYVISRNSSVKGMFCHKTLVHDYINWITETLLPDLEPNSVIIINPHHGQSKIRTITKYHSKKDMLSWLRKHNIPCSGEMHKAELFELIDKSSLNSPQSIVENTLKAYGHTVLILPLSLRNFTPNELLWCGFKAKHQTETKQYIPQSTICEFIESVSGKQWSFYEDTAMHQKNVIYGIDLDVDKALEHYSLV